MGVLLLLFGAFFAGKAVGKFGVKYQYPEKDKAALK